MSWNFEKQDEYGYYFKCDNCGCIVLSEGLPPLQCPHCKGEKK